MSLHKHGMLILSICECWQAALAALYNHLSSCCCYVVALEISQIFLASCLLTECVVVASFFLGDRVCLKLDKPKRPKGGPKDRTKLRETNFLKRSKILYLIVVKCVGHFFQIRLYVSAGTTIGNWNSINPINTCSKDP